MVKKKKYLFLLDFLSNQTDSVWEFSFLSVSEQPNRKPTIFFLLELLKKIKTLVIQLVFNFFPLVFLAIFVASYHHIHSVVLIMLNYKMFVIIRFFFPFYVRL